MVKFFTFLSVLACLVFLISGCGGTPSTEKTPSPTLSSSETVKPTPTKTTEIITEGAKRFALGQSFEYSNATFTFKSAEFMDKIPAYLEEKTYTPKNGKYLVVYFSFKGNKQNEGGGINTDIFLLQDSQGRNYQMSSELRNYEVNDLALGKKMQVPGMLLWNQENEEDSLLVYDVPTDASGFTMNIIYAEGKLIKTFAIIDLGL
ncbi:MAG: hypothetical protein ACPLPW_04225 [bacterium]